eukprot:TRINITY_DN13644_c0_g1_i2.p1 TRINITY_DN13644_c0_g1~~TRINITY_DN13644_c0_g1_i2.p1  ORF type:complete len:243 (-),score=61.91 TRINITY_DN13644_c0_g1_i2:264-992(-)
MLGVIQGLDIPGVGADIVAGNLHKWMFAPTAAAFLWTKSADIRNHLHHPVISHNLSLLALGSEEGTGKARDGTPGGLAAECRLLGTRDYSAMLAVPAAVKFWREMGGDQIAARNRELVLWAARELTASWGGEMGCAEDMVGSTVMVSLPREIPATEQTAKWVKTSLIQRASALLKPALAAEKLRGCAGVRKVQIQSLVLAKDRLWIRLSAAAYNVEREFGVLREAVLALARECSSLQTQSRL